MDTFRGRRCFGDAKKSNYTKETIGRTLMTASIPSLLNEKDGRVTDTGIALCQTLKEKGRTSLAKDHLGLVSQRLD
jgi:hypothetical protein